MGSILSGSFMIVLLPSREAILIYSSFGSRLKLEFQNFGDTALRAGQGIPTAQRILKSQSMLETMLETGSIA